MGQAVKPIAGLAGSIKEQKKTVRNLYRTVIQGNMD